LSFLYPSDTPQLFFPFKEICVFFPQSLTLSTHIWSFFGGGLTFVFFSHFSVVPQILFRSTFPSGRALFPPITKILSFPVEKKSWFLFFFSFSVGFNFSVSQFLLFPPIHLTRVGVIFRFSRFKSFWISAPFFFSTFLPQCPDSFLYGLPTRVPGNPDKFDIYRIVFHVWGR